VHEVILNSKPSYESINYDLRPAKNIERKMLAEAIGALTAFAPLKTYSYVGFGSPYFTDFALFHRVLGISKMHSIEKDVDNRSRFEFNRPLACIQLHFGRSTTVLPGLRWSDPVIAWLDYDGKLDHTVLADIAIFCQNAVSGSVVLISVNARPERQEHLRRKKLENQLRARYKIPPDITNFDFGGWGTATISRRIIFNEISECLTRVNSGLQAADKKKYEQLFNFHYKDSAEMLTTGGIIFKETDHPRFNTCDFTENYDFIRTQADAYHIEVPNLTFREFHYLNSQLPKQGHLSAKGIPSEDLEKYKRIYRWFPRFSESEFY